MKYKYTARTKEGELQAGSVEAPSNEAAANILNSHELFVLSLEGAEAKRWLDGVLAFVNRVKLGDVMVFTRQFATLLESQVPLGESIRSLHQQTRNPILKEAIYEIASDIDAGLSLSQSLERQNAVFSDFYINMVRSAEITGRLENSLSFLADYLEKETVWHLKIRNALIYPAFIVSLFFGVVVILLTVVFPKLSSVFEESNVKLPLITKILLSGGNFMLEWWWLVILLAILLIAVFVNYFKSLEGGIVLSELIFRTPVFGELFKKIYIARFTESLSVLIKGGVPITQAIEIASHNIGNLIYRDILHEIGEQVKAGESLSSLLFQNEHYFPPLVGQMVSVGETTGRLDQLLSKISSFYTREVDDIIDNLTELIQPMIIAVIGIFVGLLFAAVLIPIYNLAQGFKI